VAFSPDGTTLASASGKWDGQPEVRLWDLPAGRERSLLRGHASGVTALAFSPDGQSLATSSWDRTVRLWDVTTAAERRVLRGHTNYVVALAFSPDGEFLATGSCDGTAKLWHSRRSRDHTSLASDDPLHHAYSLSFSPDGRLLAAAGSYSAAVFDLPSGELSSVIPRLPAQAVVAFAPDGKTLAVAGFAYPDGNVRMYDTKTWQLRLALDTGANAVWTLAFSPDSRLLATGGKDLTIRLWDVKTGGQRVLYRGEAVAGKTQNIRTLAFSPDGETLAACGAPGPQGIQVRAWNVETGQVQFNLDTGWCDCIAFSPDGKTLAASDGHSTRRNCVRLWDLETRQVRAILSGHAELVYHLAFSPDGRTLATGSWDSTVRLWHVATAQPLVILKGHRGAIYCVAFSPDGKTLASGSQYRQAPLDVLASEKRLWHAPSDEDGLLQRDAGSAPQRRDANGPQSARADNNLGVALHVRRKLDEAVAYRKAIEHNDLAWRLATSSDVKLRDGGQAVALAKKAVELDPKNGAYANTLGAAHYRSGDWTAAIAALEKSMELREGSDSFDWFFLAMAHWQLGEKDKAREWFERAVKWMDEHQPANEELRRFRTEAEELMKVKGDPM
jgi:WD40 repeat protein/Tfp pilus assembly protein PilF